MSTIWIVEPVFGQIHPRHGKPVLLRGLDQAAHEWDLIAAYHYPMKLHDMPTRAILAPKADCGYRPTLPARSTVRMR